MLEGLFWCLCVTLLTKGVSACMPDSFYFSEYGRALEGYTFWSLKTKNEESCFKSCVRMKQCLSLNFHQRTTLCELNTATIADHPGNAKTRAFTIYAKFDDFPYEVDPMCFARPCDIGEVCIPGTLLLLSNPTCAGHTCMSLNFHCPVPTVGEYTTLSVGSIVTTDCPDLWTRGGGESAECLAGTFDWSKQFSLPICTDIFNSECASNSECAPIAAGCVSGRCVCADNEQFDTDTHLCTVLPPVRLVDETENAPDAGVTPNAGRLELLKDGVYYPVCRDDFSPIVVAVVCKSMGFMFGGNFHEHALYGQGTEKPYKLEQIACSYSDTNLDDCVGNFKRDGCGGDKAVGVTCYKEEKSAADVRIVGSSMEGRPEIRYNGIWGTICDKDWNMDDVNAFCATLNPALRGDKDSCGGSNCPPEATGQIWTSGMKCTKDDTNIFDCKNYGWGALNSECDNNHANDATIKCKT